ncbi:MFS transporter [Klebsiella pneumoniae subsp. pneumoniae]|nr:MFS transporter [Klebsiella pneumoniae subsp. pneumoniae]
METLFLCLMPWFVNRTGAKWALIIAGLIMSVRIVGSAVPPRPVWIGAVKMMHALGEGQLILVSVFKFIAANFDHKLLFDGLFAGAVRRLDRHRYLLSAGRAICTIPLASPTPI